MTRDAKRRARAAKREGYREAIVESSEVLFATRGAGATKVADCAAEAGISLATLYTVFPGGKAEIITAIHAARAGEMIERAQQTAADVGPADERLANGMRQAVSLGIERVHYTRMQLAEGFSWALPAVISDRIPGGRTFFEAGLEPTTRIIADGVEAGVFVADDPSHAARTTALLLQLHLAEWIERGASETADQVFEGLWRELARLLGCSEATGT